MNSRTNNHDLPLSDLEYVRSKLDWMENHEIWPNGPRYLWTDAFGVVLLVSLYEETGESSFLSEAKEVVSNVTRVLGRERGCVSVGLQSINRWSERVNKLNDYFRNYTSGDEYDELAITHVMACCSRFPGRLVSSYG